MNDKIFFRIVAPFLFLQSKYLVEKLFCLDIEIVSSISRVLPVPDFPCIISI